MLQYAAFGLIMLCSSAMNNLFVTFYLNSFIHHSELRATHFYFGQSLYLIWNALNDPLLGFLQDSQVFVNSRSTSGSSNQQRMQTRLKAIRFGGILWCLAFAFVWFPPQKQATGDALLLAHFALSICLYDTFLTLVELSHTALLSELTTASQERAKFNSYAAILAGLGSFSSFFGQYYYNNRDLTQFRALMIAIASVCVMLFLASTAVLSKQKSTGSSNNSSFINLNNALNDNATTPEKPERKRNAIIGGFLFELRKHYNFWIFVVISSIQTFDCSYEKTSFVSLLESSSSSSSSVEFRGLVVSMSFFLPWLVTFMLTKQIQRHGVNRCISVILYTRLVVCVAMYLYPTWFLLLINRVCSELVCRLTPLVLADLVDEDRFLHQRELNETKAASVIGSCHFFSKITSSLGPMLTFALMTSSPSSSSSPAWWIFIPFACVSVQILLWTRKFFLYNNAEYFAKVKNFVERV